MMSGRYRETGKNFNFKILISGIFRESKINGEMFNVVLLSRHCHFNGVDWPQCQNPVGSCRDPVPPEIYWAVRPSTTAPRAAKEQRS